MQKPHDVSLRTDRLVLRLITQNDLQNVFDTMNFKHTAQTISFLTWPMTMEQAQAWCDKSSEGSKNQTDHLYIARNKQGQAVGCIGLHDLKTAAPETGYWVSELHQGQGYAFEMLKAVIEYAFGVLDLETLHATVIPDNVKSLHLLQKNRFQITGKTNIPVEDGKISERYTVKLVNPAKI